MKPSEQAVWRATRRMDDRLFLALHARSGEAHLFFMRTPEKRENYIDMVFAAQDRLKDDTPQKWHLDMAILERHHGGRNAARAAGIWGRTAGQLIRHFDATNLKAGWDEEMAEHGMYTPRVMPSQVHALMEATK